MGMYVDTEHSDEPIEPRRKISADEVFFQLASRLPITPTMTFCEEVAVVANRNVTNTLWVHEGGQLVVLDPIKPISDLHPNFRARVEQLVDMNGLVEEWNEKLIKHCTTGCSTYGIFGMT